MYVYGVFHFFIFHPLKTAAPQFFSFLAFVPNPVCESTLSRIWELVCWRVEILTFYNNMFVLSLTVSSQNIYILTMLLYSYIFLKPYNFKYLCFIQ